jgi:hypothetical protein
MIVAIWTALLLAASPQARPEPAFCSVSGGAGQPPSVESTRALVRRAEVVVRVHAAEYRRPPEMQGFPPMEIRFHVLEVLHGSDVPADLWIRAGAVAHDDFNDHPVPYLYARPDSRRGGCYAYFHRDGGEFLLLLSRDRQGLLTPYWSMGDPTNEQVRGASDPWVVWVREQLRAPRAPGT